MPARPSCRYLASPPRPARYLFSPGRPARYLASPGRPALPRSDLRRAEFRGALLVVHRRAAAPGRVEVARPICGASVVPLRIGDPPLGGHSLRVQLPPAG